MSLIFLILIQSLKTKFDLQELLEMKFHEYNRLAFIEDDPVQIPHAFSKKQDIEIAGFFSATLAWGQRKTIIAKNKELMHLMDNAPHDFILNHQDGDLKKLDHFKHRTFNSTDLLYFIAFLKMHYSRYDSLEEAFTQSGLTASIEDNLKHFNNYFFSLEYFPSRTRKHVATPERKSACKRINMFLRWMVRTDNQGVDFGIWKTIKPSQLICPIDLHVDRVARKLKLIKRKQVDWQTAVELTEALKKFDPNDPVKYDFALFGLGVNEKY